MSSRQCVAWYDREDSILEAVIAARRVGYPIDDVYTPYVVHGMDEAMGLQPTRLRWVCFGCGLFGLLLGFSFQAWTSFDWPLNIGGKPLLAAPSFIPVSFELMTLFAALGTVAALFARARLYPSRKPGITFPKVSGDRFALALVSNGSLSDDEEKKAFCERMGAVAVDFVEAGV